VRVRKMHPQATMALDHGDDPEAQLTNLRLIVATRLDGTDSARESGTLARVLLDIEAALAALRGSDVGVTAVDDLLAKRAERRA
jgi:hypothetical protein